MSSLPPYNPLFLTVLASSTLMALSSNHWFIMWASMELNLMSFTPLMCSLATNQEQEASIKYFLAQAIGSSLLLLSLFYLSSPLPCPSTSTTTTLFLMSLLLKLGAAPGHFWFPAVMAATNWSMSLLLTTWQKIIPLWALMHTALSQNSNALLYTGALGALLGGLGGMNQTHFRPILSYSSINHSGWMVALSAASSTMTLLYFLIYSSTMALIMCPLMATHMQPPNNETTSSPAPFKTTTALLLLSMGGLPPLMGFLPKLLAIHLLSHFSPTAVILVLILGSLASLYFYITLTLALFYSPLSTPHTNPTNPRALPPALSATTLLYLTPLLLLMVT